MNLEINACSGDLFHFPCFLIIDGGETYPSLAEKYYARADDALVQRLEQANDVEYFYNDVKGWPDLQPISTLEPDMIIVLPITP